MKAVKVLVAEDVFLRLLHKPAVRSVWTDELSSAGKCTDLELRLKCVLC